MMKVLTAGLLCVLLLNVTACSTGPLDVSIPMNRLDSPEANGEDHRFRGDMGHRSNHRVRLTQDYGAQRVNGAVPKIESIAKSGASAGVGVIERLDLDLKVTGDVPVVYQAKYQLLGQSRSKAEVGNFSVAVSAAFGSAESRDQVSDLSGIFGGVSNIASYSLKRSLYDLGLITGYRLNEAVLSYGGLSFTHLGWEGTQKPYVGSTDAFQGRANQTMIHSGFILKSKASAYAQFEASVARLITDGANATHVNGAATVGVHF